MIDYLQTKVCEIGDAAFQSMIGELCNCINLDRDQFDNQPLSYLLMIIGKEKRALTRQHLAVDGVLTTQVDKLLPGSVVHTVCRQLATANNTILEAFDGKTVLTLIKQTHKLFCPTSPRPKALTRRQSSYQFQTDLIERRRRNGDL